MKKVYCIFVCLIFFFSLFPFVPVKMLPFYSCTSKYEVNLTRCCWCIPARLIFSKKKHSRDAPFDALVFGAHIFIKAQPIRSWWCEVRHNSPRDASKVRVIIWENRSGAHLSLNCCAPTNIQLWLWKHRLFKSVLVKAGFRASADFSQVQLSHRGASALSALSNTENTQLHWMATWPRWNYTAIQHNH